MECNDKIMDLAFKMLGKEPVISEIGIMVEIWKLSFASRSYILMIDASVERFLR